MNLFIDKAEPLLISMLNREMSYFPCLTILWLTCTYFWAFRHPVLFSTLFLVYHWFGVISEGVSILEQQPFFLYQRYCMVQCIVCQAANSIGSTYAMKRTAILLFCAFLFIGSAFAVTFSTYGPLLQNRGVPIVWVAAIVMGIGLIGRGIMYLIMPVAVIIAYRPHEDSWVLGRMETRDRDFTNPIDKV